ncbi:hypothetical protein POVWA2_027990 [Plasmodium ovale wallikeri]|uniref:Uncharacterized protein n=1 Tax=Plasmodium ovale wallikeri TaxID=864142 RepID=A0A1A8YWR0_PLAOA|nr:hypothetical protein POVWA2_027990 [Plasmodium ovale wallikeri]
MFDRRKFSLPTSHLFRIFRTVPLLHFRTVPLLHFRTEPLLHFRDERSVGVASLKRSYICLLTLSVCFLSTLFPPPVYFFSTKRKTNAHKCRGKEVNTPKHRYEKDVVLLIFIFTSQNVGIHKKLPEFCKGNTRYKKLCLKCSILYIMNEGISHLGIFTHIRLGVKTLCEREKGGGWSHVLCHKYISTPVHPRRQYDDSICSILPTEILLLV